jgi:hypothetical protein
LTELLLPEPPYPIIITSSKDCGIIKALNEVLVFELLLFAFPFISLFYSSFYNYFKLLIDPLSSSIPMPAVVSLCVVEDISCYGGMFLLGVVTITFSERPF